jgi:hypothetical protein
MTDVFKGRSKEVLRRRWHPEKTSYCKLYLMTRPSATWSMMLEMRVTIPLDRFVS